jgi:hypothetical protein
MQRTKKPKPLAVCTICRALIGPQQHVNQRCDKVVSGRRCAGTFHSDLSFVWDPCQECEATGWVGSQVCSSCSGFGWRLFGE